MGTLITNGARGICVIESSLPLQTQHSRRRRRRPLHQQVGLKCKEGTGKNAIFSITFYGAETLYTSESRSETRGKSLNVVQEKDGQDQFGLIGLEMKKYYVRSRRRECAMYNKLCTICYVQ